MFKDIKKKAEEKASEVKDVTTSVGSKVADQAKNLGESASDLATGAVKTASDAASSAGKMAKGAIDSVVISLATKIVVRSMKRWEREVPLISAMTRNMGCLWIELGKFYLCL